MDQDSDLEDARTLEEVINRLRQRDDAIIFDLYTELEEEQITNMFFRWHSDSTQKMQNRVLKQYTNYLCLFKLVSKDASEEEKEAARFPTDKKLLFDRLRTYMTFICRYGRGRGSKKISYRGVVKYRQAILFWAKRSYAQREVPPIPFTTLFNQLTEAIRGAARTYRLNVTGKLNSTHVGSAELLQLIDYDVVQTANIAVAECHHVAWLIGRVCAVRPGSLGWSSKSKLDDGLYLKWKDIEFTRGTQRGWFEARITFRSLKTNSNDHETQMHKADTAKTLVCVVRPPTKQGDLMFSIPHRLLAIALRRSIVVGANSIEELLDGNLHLITIKHDYLDDPVLLCSRPRGLTTGDGPLSASGLSSYLQNRGQRLGYGQPITFYSIRRRTATDLARRIGTNAARIIMNHDVESRCLERYYMDTMPTVDLTGLSLGEKGDMDTHGHSAAMVAANNPLAINVLTTEASRTVHGPALNALVRQMINTHPKPPSSGSDKDWRNFTRRIRYGALKTLLSETFQKQRAAMTTMEFDERVRKLEQSKMMDRILETAHTAANNAPDLDDQNDSLNKDIDPVTGDFLEGNAVSEAPEEDLEQQIRKGAVETDDDGNIIKHCVSEQEDSDDTHVNTEITYDAAVAAFMEELMTNSLNEHRDFKNDPVNCTLCAEDETVDEEMKSKLYHARIKLQLHIDSKYHLPKTKWLRALTIEQSLDGEKRPYCPYCKALDQNNVIHYHDTSGIIRHIEKGANNSKEHQDLAYADGWFVEKFSGWVDEALERKVKFANHWKSKNRDFNLKRFGFNESNEKELKVGLPTSNKHIVRGGEYKMPSNPHAISFTGDFSTLVNAELPARFSSIIQRGDQPAEYKIPEWYRGVIIASNGPGEENIQEDAGDSAVDAMDIE